MRQGGGCFSGICFWCRKLFYVWHQLFVEYKEQYSEQCHGQFIVQYSVQCSGQYSTSK